MPEKPPCSFCNKSNMDGRIVLECKGNRRWYAFVPRDPEIFGHVLVTVDKPHVQNIEDTNPHEMEFMNDISKGIVNVSIGLKRIENVEKVYVLMLGESSDVHMHYHLIPRYKFGSMKDRIAWATEYELIEGKDEWRSFYSRPTMGFTSNEGFRYLGEVERLYNEFVIKSFSVPDERLLGEMTKLLKIEIGNP